MDTEVLKQKYKTAAESKETHSTGRVLLCVSILGLLCDIQKSQLQSLELRAASPDRGSGYLRQCEGSTKKKKENMIASNTRFVK